MNIANLITIGRIFLVPLVVWAIASDEMLLAFIFFCVASISDAVDGFIARHFNQKSELGAYLDPLADKALLVSIYLTLAISGILPRWIVILVVFRDILIIGAVMLSWLLSKPVEINPLKISKLTTLAQIILAGLVLAVHGFALDAHGAVYWAQIMVAVLTGLSASAYLIDWVRHMAHDE